MRLADPSDPSRAGRCESSRGRCGHSTPLAVIRPDLVPALFLAAPVAIVGLDADLVVALANPAVCHLLSVDPRMAAEVVLGRSFSDFVHPDDRDIIRAQWNKVQASPRDEGTGRFRVRNGDGGVVQVEFQLRPAWFSDDRLELVALSMRPAGPEGVAATTVVTIEPMADIVLQTVEQAAALLDIDGMIRVASPKFVELVGDGDLRGREMVTFLHPEDRRAFIESAFGNDNSVSRQHRILDVRLALGAGRVLPMTASVGRRDTDRSGDLVVAFAERTEKGSEGLSAPMRQLLVRTMGALAQTEGDELSEAVVSAFSSLCRLAGADAAALLVPGQPAITFVDRKSPAGLTFTDEQILKATIMFRDEDIVVEDRDQLMSGDRRTLLNGIGARSLISVPVRVGSEIGIFILARTTRTGAWTRMSADAAAIIGRAAASAVQRTHNARPATDEVRRWRSMVERSSDMLLLVDRDAKIRYASPASMDILGRDSDDLVDLPVFDVITPDAAVGLDGVNDSAIYQAVHRDGSARYLDAVASNLLDDPHVSALVISARDVTARLEAERARQEADDRYRSVIDHVGVVVWRAGTDRRWTQLGPMWTNLNVSSVEDTIGEPMINSLHPEDGSRFQARLAELAAGRAPEIVIDVRLSGTPLRWVNVKARLARDDEGMVVGYLGTLADITERRLAAEAREHDATHDALTKLPNRAFLRRHLSEAVERVRVVGGDHLAVLVIDLDGLKLVNDALGHETGDQVLLEIATRLTHACGPSTVLARFGSDEFVAVVESSASDEDLLAFARSLVRGVGDPIDAGGHPVIVSACIGLGRLGRDGADATALLRAADVAAQWAKRGGRDQVCFHDASMRPRSTARLTLEADLRRALDHNQFVLHYQPIYDAQSGLLRAGEALVRWNHPERGMIAPGEFIRVAEESGLIVPLGEWVLTAALSQRRAWAVSNAVPQDYRVFVNLSVRQLMSPGFAERIVKLFQEHGVDPNHVCLELTESTFVEDTERIGVLLRALGRLGCAIALDDFGTGYSTFTVLRDLPFTMVKIDRSLVEGLGRSEKGNAVVNTVLSSARELGIETVAEGIERADQFAVLRSLGCDFVQGYLLGRPSLSGGGDIRQLDMNALLRPPVVVGSGVGS